MKQWDVVIVGGGMVGASFALALRATKLRTLLIEGVPPDSAAQPSFDERTTALGNGSRQIFESLGVWQAMAPDSAPIRSIHVSEAGRFGVARLDAREQGVAAFGYVVPNRVIGRVLWQALRAAPNLTLAMPAQVKRASLVEDGVELEVEREGAIERVRASVAANLDAGQQVAARVEERRRQEMLAMVATLAENPTLKAALDTWQSERTLGGVNEAELVATVQREAEKIAVRIDADVLALVDVDGKVVASAGRHATAWPWHQSSRVARRRRARAGPHGTRAAGPTAVANRSRGRQPAHPAQLPAGALHHAGSRRAADGQP